MGTTNELVSKIDETLKVSDANDLFRWSDEKSYEDVTALMPTLLYYNLLISRNKYVTHE